jgi:hypothetical protein
MEKYVRSSSQSSLPSHFYLLPVSERTTDIRFRALAVSFIQHLFVAAETSLRGGRILHGDER